MLDFSILFVLLAQLFAFATASVSTYSQSVCATSLTNKKPVSVPTSTYARTLTFKPKVTVVITNTLTVTPTSASVTSVTTSTSSTTTTITQATDTFTLTSTSTISDTTTTTLIRTETDYSTETTTVYSTSTVPASAGFTPLASELAATGYIPAKKNRRTEKLRTRVAKAEPASNAVDQEKRRGSKLFGGPSEYPAAVTCTKLVEILSTSTVYLTAKETATVTASQGTITSTSTTVLTTTLTSVPIDASTTLTESATTEITITATATSTLTTTLTTTSTAFAPLATSYDACDTNNLVSTINGSPITNAGPLSGNAFTFSTSSSDSAYNCCVTCIQSDTCGASLFYGAANQCYMFGYGSTCSGSTADAVLYTNIPGALFTASNGVCGQFAYTGSFP